jgi:hypothetical protein
VVKTFDRYKLFSVQLGSKITTSTSQKIILNNFVILLPLAVGNTHHLKHHTTYISYEAV